ncbi:hypothetical protein GCM10011511_29940 [Puia dinghuensis]|uniref:Amino acid ABC transporter substrate-binding protein n=1 Tax=Puia dinghuensis TaxID=1792502 RepID=A0A8J2UEJ7_9BACT|nr:hypothetical protein GCM10011511_29940 [Puia dinghuensis]
MLLVLGLTLGADAQVDSTMRLNDSLRRKIAIFAPLYLDSAFDATGAYRYDKNFPKFINPGLEFYEGARMALDTLQKEHAMLDVRLYDTRAAGMSLQQQLDSASALGVDLIIGQVNSATELQQIATAAMRKNIPFINANYPNDAGITNNPSLVILNSTLRAHCEAIYRYLQRNYPTRPLVFFRKKGSQEERLKGYFTELDKKTMGVPLKIKYVTLEDNFDAPALAASMDSLTQTVCIAGSLDDDFATKLCALLATLNRSYHTTIIGMPTWDNLDLARPEFAGEEIAYSTPFYLNQADTLVKLITNNFKTRFYSRPSDMVFRGYESTYHFAKLLLLHGSNLNGSIGEKKFKVFNDLEIMPVFLNRQTMTLDYFENKKLYFIRKLDGAVVGVN